MPMWLCKDTGSRWAECWIIGISRINKAALIENVEDLEYILGWEYKKKKPDVIQRNIFSDISNEEKLILNVLKESGEISIDHIYLETKLPVSKVSTHLLNLEF